MGVNSATLTQALRRLANVSSGMSIHRAHFLKNDVRLVMLEHGMGLPVEAFQDYYFVRSHIDPEKVSMDNIGKYLEVKSELGFMELIAFLTSEKTALYFSPFRYLYTDGGSSLSFPTGVEGHYFPRSKWPHQYSFMDKASSFFDGAEGRYLPRAEWDKYPFQPAEFRKYGNNHFGVEMDCLCNRQGRLSRLSFEVNNNVLSIREVRNYTEQQRWGYYHYL
jgi:hypothetical protein